MSNTTDPLVEITLTGRVVLGNNTLRHDLEMWLLESCVAEP
jgi:hypothetical protein